MSVLYRALWSDPHQKDATTYVAKARQLFAAWAYGRPDADELPEGETEIPANDRARTVAVRTLPVDEVDPSPRIGVECIARDVDQDGATWTTVMRVVATSDEVKVWVENRIETDDISVRIKVGRPRLVDDLVAIPGKPHLGGSGLFTEPQQFSRQTIAALVEYLRSPERTLPVIVCSEPGGDHDDSWKRTADRIARRAGGIATVVTLDSTAVTALKEQLGDLANWGGAVRVYTPGPVNDPADGWRHRYYLGRLMSEHGPAMVDRIVYSVAQMSARRPVPEEFLAFTTTAPAASQTQTGERFISEEEAERERASWQALLDQEVAATNEIERELAQKIGHLERIKSTLEAQGLHDLFYGTQHEDANDVPDVVQDTSEAVLAAQTYLSAWLNVHDEASRELDGIDTGPNSYSWGNTTWRGLRALAAFAEARNGGFQGSFYDWCRTGPPLGWPATDKKLSMTESETVQNNRRLSRLRCLPVSTDVEPSGEVTMWSHLKISEGGGDLAPRVYFYDDTNGATKKMHVGFVGPHYLMPNTKS